MGGGFDPYYKWLGIPPGEQPPNHYRLLGITVFENDLDVIEAAADRQMVHVRTYQGGKHAAQSQRLLNELSAARVCLLNPQSKAAYDASLRAQVGKQQNVAEPNGATQQDAPQQNVEAGPSFGFYVKGAARYLSSQFQRLWIRQTRLPAAYWRLGVEVHRQRGHVGHLQGLYGQLESLAHRLDSLVPAEGPEVKHDQPAARRISKDAWWRRCIRSCQAVLLQRKRASLLRTIGRRAYELDPVGGGPPDLLRAVHEELTCLERLRAEADRLSEVPPGQVLSPARLAWIVASVAGFFVSFWLLLRLR